MLSPIGCKLYLVNPDFDLGSTRNSLRSEDPKIDIRCTHARTNWDHNNAFP